MLALPTFVIGPRNPEGRDFSFLAESLPIASLTPAAQSVASALPLALSAWSRHGEAGCIAAVPLGQGEDHAVLVMRVAMLGFTDIGRLVFANAVLVDGAALAALDHATERLLHVIPLPDGNTHFGQSALVIEPDTLSLGARDDWPGLGLGWQDRLVLIDRAEDAEAALASALASIEPAAQRQRIRGWSTSGGFTRVGGFDPASAFQLVVMQDQVHPPPEGLLPYRASHTGFSGEPATAPASYDAWRTLTGMLGYGAPGSARAEDLPAWLRWRYEDSVAAPDAVIGRILRGAAATLAGPDIVRLLALIAACDDRRLADPARALFWQLIERQSDDTAAAFYPSTLAREHPDATPSMLAEGWQASRLSPLNHIGEELVSLMLANGLLASLASHPASLAWVATAPIGHVIRLAAALAQPAASGTDATDRLIAEATERLAGDGAREAPTVFAAVVERAAGRLSKRRWLPAERARLIDTVAELRPQLMAPLARDWLTLNGEQANRGRGRAGVVALWLRLTRMQRTIEDTGA